MLPRKFLRKNTQKRCFQRFWKASISFLGKAGVHSNSLYKVKYLMKIMINKWQGMGVGDGEKRNVAVFNNLIIL